MKYLHLILFLLISTMSIASEGNTEKKRRKRNNYREKVGLHFNTLGLTRNMAGYPANNYILSLEYTPNGTASYTLTMGTQNTSITVLDVPNNYNNPVIPYPDLHFSGFMVALGYQFYFNPNREGNSNFFLEPYLKYSQLANEGASIYGYSNGSQLMLFDITRSMIIAGLNAGNVFTFNRSNFVLTISGGFGYALISQNKFSNGFVPSSEDQYSFTPLDYRLNFGIGYRIPIKKDK